MNQVGTSSHDYAVNRASNKTSDTATGHPAELRSLPPLSVPSPPSGSSDEDGVYDDADDAQSFIEPIISPVATRMMSPKTPAAEKMAAMDDLLDDYFQQPSDQSAAGDAAASPSQTERPAPPLPTPWRAGPRQIIVDQAQNSRPSLFGVFNQPSRQRSSSGSNVPGSDALKRLSRALPSISLPSGIFPSSFFSTSPTSPEPINKNSGAGHRRSTVSGSASSNTMLHKSTASSSTLTGPGRSSTQHPQSPRSLSRSKSHESMLYYSLSRASSYGDDTRFNNVRDQVNSRFKAIVDSFDPPFKVPNIRNPFAASDTVANHGRSGPPSPTKAGISDMLSLDRVLANLTGDLVIMGGYRGSVLRSAEAPHRQMWVPVKVGLNIRKVNLQLGLQPEDEEQSEELVIPSGMLKNIGPVDISRKLFRKLRECENYRNGTLRVHDYGYDWRLSPHVLSKKLLAFLKTLPCNTGPHCEGAMVIAHSLGGLITRHVVNQHPMLFSGVVYAGSPQRCVNILGPFRNGDAVLLNEKLLTAATNFSMRSTFVFLPEDGVCFQDKHTGEKYDIDFYNPDDWIKYRLSPCIGEPCLPPLGVLANGTNRSSAMSSFRTLSENIATRSRSASDSATRKAEQVLRQANPFDTKDRSLAPQMKASPSDEAKNTSTKAFSKDALVQPAQQEALQYLRRTLAETKQFRAELAHKPEHQTSNQYPPMAIMYGKNTPTVYAARVIGRDGIAHADAYDDLAFQSGDGVVLAREAMPPSGYELVNGGRISTERGHVTMLSDLDAVGRALEAVMRGRRKGIGLGGDMKG